MRPTHSDLTRPAAAAVRCLGVGPNDDVLVRCDADQRTIADALAVAAWRSARSVRTAEFPSLTRHGEEPPAAVADAMAQASVIFAATTVSIGHTDARVRGSNCGARIATLPGITLETFKRAVSVDYAELKRTGEHLAAGAASSCNITSPAGTDIGLSLAGRTAICDDGDLHAEGAWETYRQARPTSRRMRPSATARSSSTAHRRYGALREPLRITLTAGRATDAHGEAAQWLLNTLDQAGPTGRMLAEIGIGTNPRATLPGNILEDEKVAGTAYLTFGTSAPFGGTTLSTVHIDGVLLHPTIELDHRPPLRNGKLLNPREDRCSRGRTNDRSDCVG